MATIIQNSLLNVPNLLFIFQLFMSFPPPYFISDVIQFVVQIKKVGDSPIPLQPLPFVLDQITKSFFFQPSAVEL